MKHFSFKMYIIVAAVLLVGAAGAAWIFLQKPVISDIRVGKVESSADMEAGKEIKTYPGKYLTFSYSGIYTEKSHETPDGGPVKESILLSATGLEGQKIAIVVEKRDTLDFQESPAYQMRLNKSNEYARETVTLGDWSGELFKKDVQVFERTLFLKHKNFIVSLSATSPFNADNLDNELSSIVGSLRFRE